MYQFSGKQIETQQRNAKSEKKKLNMTITSMLVYSSNKEDENTEKEKNVKTNQLYSLFIISFIIKLSIGLKTLRRVKFILSLVCNISGRRLGNSFASNWFSVWSGKSHSRKT